MEKGDLRKAYWNPQRKLGAATHFFEIISFESRKKADVGVFLKKKENIFLRRIP